MIDTPDALHDLVDRALHADAVAVDTEFVWERTFYPRLGLIQIGLGEDDCHLIDAPALKDLEPLGELLAAPSVVKILHDPGQDLTILRRATGAVPQNIFDTQLAAGFVGLTATLSLGDLLRAVLEVDLPKTQTRTNWLQRPLTSAQQAYALNDVRHLPALREALLERVEARQRGAWLTEELARYDDPDVSAEDDPRARFRRVSGAGRLSRRQLAVLREATAWREEEARRQDRPRGHILADKALAAVARRTPRSRDDLRGIRNLSDKEARRYGDALLQAVEAGLNVPAEETPVRDQRPRPDEALQARVNVVLGSVTGKSLAEDIDPALLGSRADLTEFLMRTTQSTPDGHPLLQGWRRTFIGEDLLRLLEGEAAIYLEPDSGLPTLAHDD